MLIGGILYAGIETGVFDGIYTAYVLNSDKYSSEYKSLVAGGFVASATLPGGGYSFAPFLTSSAKKVTTGSIKATQAIINPTINITRKGLAHTVSRHTFNGISKWASKSKFFNTSEIESLIQLGTQVPMVKQNNGYFARFVNAGRNIGIDRATSNPTSIYTIITDGLGNLVTAFPGIP